MPKPYKPIYRRGRRTGNRKPLTHILKEYVMNNKLGKLKSRKLWVAVLGGALVALGTELGFDRDTVNSLVAVIAAYLLGQGMADINSNKTLPLLAILCMLALAPVGYAGDTELSEEPTVPDLGIEVPVDTTSWLDKGSIWSFVWADTNGDDNGMGLRLGYEVTEHIRMRFDYMIEDFNFDSGVFAEDSELTLSMRYVIFPNENLFPYLIAGGGSASLSSFEWQYLIGAGVDYEIGNGVTAFAEFLHIRNEDDDFNDRNEARIGVGIQLSKIGALVKNIPFPKLPSNTK